ncbi:MAG: hypothetical protein DRG20_00900 [Deltaproteobacteria bacterium]|nr:MAG: hypothetical protein DRG20_00900 [Deltaproteobacteria bacterium]
MRGIPKRFATKQDYLNILDILKDKKKMQIARITEADREKFKEHVKALVNTMYRLVPVYPKGYDPEKDMDVQPKWLRKPDPNGKIFKLGFTVEELRELGVDEDTLKKIKFYMDKFKEKGRFYIRLIGS